MLFDLHGITINFESHDALINERIAASFSSLPRVNGDAQIIFALELVTVLPPAPGGELNYVERDLIHYYLDSARVVAHFPRYGQMRIDLAAATIGGEIIASAITTYGVFEDLLAIGLSPLLRRRGKFLIHAFSAAYENRAVLLVGGIGAGKTTTGIALLHAGWKLLSNDSPLLDEPSLDVLCYPGLLSAFNTTLKRFPELHSLIGPDAAARKATFTAESIYPNVWLERAPLAAIFFPHVANAPEHQIEKLAPPDALRMLLPHAVERWDAEMIPAHLALLNRVIAQTPAYELALAPNTDTLAALITDQLMNIA